MHEAQCLAGMAFSNALLGITHSMAHKIGAVFDITHGCAAMQYSYLMLYNSNSKVCEERYANIARYLGLEGKSDKDLVNSLINFIRNLNKELGIDSSLKEYGIAEDEFKGKVEYMAHNAVLDACTGANPRKINEEEMKNMYTYAFYGKDIDF